MKKTNKFLSGLLAFMMVIGMSSGIYAAPTPSDVVSTVYEEAATVLSGLDIMVGDEGGFRPESNLKRSEFAKIAVAALGLADVAQNYTYQTKYPDVSSDHWANGYINVASNQRLVIGDESGNFNPDSPITYAEAITVIVRMLGHEPATVNKGTWPTNFLVVGAQIGVTKGVASHNMNDEIIRGTIAEMTYNALTINMMKQVGFGDNTRYEVVDETILVNRLDVEKISGQISGNEFTKLTSDVSLKADQVQIGTDIYKTGQTNAKNLLGYNVELYAKQDMEGNMAALAVVKSKAKNNDVTIDSENIASIAQSGNRYMLKYWLDKDNSSSTKTVYLDGSANLIYNGVYEEFNVDDVKPDYGSVTLLDSNRDDLYDVVFTSNSINYVVDQISTVTHTISDKYGVGVLKLDPEDKDINFSITKDGQNFDFANLKEWHVLSVSQSKNSNVLNLTVSDKKVSGVVSELYDEKVRINGLQYAVANNYKNAISLAEEGVFYLDVNDKISAVDTTNSLNTNYAYLLAGEKESNFSTKINLKVFTKTGETKILQTAERISLNGAAMADATTVLNTLKAGAQDVAPQLVTLSYNTDGEVTKINTATDKTTTQEYNRGVFTKSYTANDVAYKSTTSKLNRFTVTENTVIFDLPSGQSIDKYAVRSKEMFANDGKYNIEIYDLNEDLSANVVIVTNSNGKTNAESSIAVVESITPVKNERGDDAQKLYMLYKGEMVNMLTTQMGILVKDGGKALQNGDVIQFSTDVNGAINSVSLLLDITQKDTEFNITDGNLQLVYGKVDKKFSFSMNVTVNDEPVENYSLQDVSVYKYDSTKNRNRLSVASANDITKYEESENQRVFVKIYKDVVQEIVIVK